MSDVCSWVCVLQSSRARGSFLSRFKLMRGESIIRPLHSKCALQFLSGNKGVPNGPLKGFEILLLFQLFANLAASGKYAKASIQTGIVLDHGFHNCVPRVQRFRALPFPSIRLMVSRYPIPFFVSYFLKYSKSLLRMKCSPLGPNRRAPSTCSA